MYTDGVIEAEDESDRLFGLEKLCDIIDQNRDSDARDIVSAILSGVNLHTKGSSLTDDTTVVVLKKP
jgi:serine phosphatase RsbU (regulator of sigma subunit)